MYPIFIEAATQHPSFKFHLREQPANSPDTNVLDLGFFCALQTAFWKLRHARNIDGMIANVEAAWRDYPADKLYFIWLTHMAVMDKILINQGSNDFDIPHVGKERLQQHGDLPHPLNANAGAILMASEFLEI